MPNDMSSISATIRSNIPCSATISRYLDVMSLCGGRKDFIVGTLAHFHDHLLITSN